MNPVVTDLLWQRASEVLFITKEQFLRSLEGWDVEPFEIEGETVGATLTKGPEFHFQSFGTGRPFTMKVVRRALQKTFDAHGHVVTRTPKHETRQHRFNRALGFKAVGEDEYDIHYRLERIRGCPQQL